MKRIVLFTPLMLQSIKIKPKEYALYDAACDGLALRVQPSGAISWVVWENCNGKVRRITLGRFDTLDLDAARQLARARMLGGPNTPVSMIRERTISFAQLAERFLEAKRGVYTAGSYKSLALYMNTQLIPALGSTPVGNIKTAQVADWFYGFSRTSPGGANQVIGYFTTLLNWGKEHGHLPEDINNPASPIKRNRRAARGRLLNSAQLRDLARVLNNPPSRNKNAADAILIILLTGCRSGEIMRLKWAEVKKTRLTLMQTKTGPRDVLLTDTVIERLKRRKIGSCSPYVFPSMTNPDRPLTSLDGSWRTVKKKAGLPDDIRLHDLRHTYASHAIMSGETLAITGKLLGHKTPRSTEVYAHLEARHLAKAADKVAKMVDAVMGGLPLHQHRARVSAKSPLGGALKYIAKYWDGLNLFLTDGRIEMDNNAVERTIRPIALNRKNALFAGHDAGAENWGIIASLIETCKLNGIEPHAYLTTILSAIVNGHKQSQIDELLPWNYVTTV